MEMTIRSPSGETADVGEAVSAVTFSDNINKAGILNFSLIGHGPVPEEGSAVTFKYGGETYFSGFMFKVSKAQQAEVKITAYDQLRYLKASETYVFENMTASGVLRQICRDFQLKTGTIEETGYNLGSQIFDGKALLDIIADCTGMTLTATKRMYFIKDNAGAIELRSIENMVTDLCIDPESLLYGYSYDRSIDGDTYNQIKLVRDNDESGLRELYVTRDSANIKKWGLLQYYEKADAAMNAAQLREKANAMLELKNRVGQKLSVSVIGDRRVRAGNAVYLSVPDAGIAKYLLCTAAQHTFSASGYTAKADFKLV